MHREPSEARLRVTHSLQIQTVPALVADVLRRVACRRDDADVQAVDGPDQPWELRRRRLGLEGNASPLELGGVQDARQRDAAAQALHGVVDNPIDGVVVEVVRVGDVADVGAAR